MVRGWSSLTHSRIEVEKCRDGFGPGFGVGVGVDMGKVAWRTALGNVMAGLEFRGVPDARARAEEWLRRVGLGGFGDRYPHQLSGGMRKRTSLAQTLALDPDIILMD